MPNFITKLIKNKRTSSEYIKFENGTVKTIDSLKDVDSAPKLSNNDINVNNSKNVTSNKLGIIGGSILYTSFLVLFIFLFNFYLNKTNIFMTTNINPVDTVPAPQFSTKTITEPKDKNINISTEIDSINPIEIETKTNPVDIVEVTINTNKNISSILSDIRNGMVYYYHGKSNRYTIDTMLKSKAVSVQKNIENLKLYEKLYKELGATDIYKKIINRYENLNLLISSLQGEQSKEGLIEIANKYIKVDGELLSNEINLFISFLKKKNIEHYIKNNQINIVVSK